MEKKPAISGEKGSERLALIDELESLEQKNQDRWFVKVLIPVFAVCLILASARGSIEWGLGAAASFAAFVALMVTPIRRLERIAELRRQLDEGASEVGGTLRASTGVEREAEEDEGRSRI